MKLPFTIKKPDLSGLTGVFSRLASKIKRSKDVTDEEAEGEDDDLFGDLGDLDQLDAEAAEKAAEGDGSSGEEDDFADFDNKDLDDEPEDDFDDDDDDDDIEDHDFADLEHENEEGDAPALPSGSPASELMEELGEFDIEDALDEDAEEDDDEEAQKAKLKKLAILAGGGVGVAMVIGGLAWWLLGGDDAPAPGQAEVAAADEGGQGASGDLVISLDDVPPFVDDTPVAPAQATLPPAGQQQDQGTSGGLAPPSAGSAPGSPAPEMEVEETGEMAELKKLGLDVQMEPGVGVVIPSVTKASYEGLADWPASEPLADFPVPTLVVQGEHGLLPIVGQDGNTPFDAYRRPEPTQKSGDPKIAIIVTGLGLSRASTEAAIMGLPAEVALSLDVYARGLDFWIKRARTAGHEVLLNMPGESADFPFSDPGPNALKALVPPDENIKQLEWILSRTTGYFGVLSVYGSKFLSVEEQVQAVLDVVKQRGLMYVDGGAEDSLGPRVAYKVGAKWATVDITLDRTPGTKAMNLQLQDFEALAKKRAIAVARISTDPGTLENLSTWLKSLKDKGLVLVPVSSLANKQLIR